MENHNSYTFTEALLADIQKTVNPKSLAWIEPIPFEEKTFPPFLLVALTNGSSLAMKWARETIISTAHYPLNPTNLSFCHYEVIKRASLFNFLHLTNDRLMVAPNASFPFQAFSKAQLESRFLESKLIFQGFANKAVSFYRSGMHLLNLKDFNTATFMFHQAIELGLRAAEVFALGKGTKSHILYRHILAAQSYSPALAELFLDANNNCIPIIKTLEGSYLGARYSYSFSVSKDELADIPELLEEFYSRLFQLPMSYENAINEFTPFHSS